MSTASKVAIIMGSKSDLPIVQGAFKIFDEFGIAYTARVMSAHRTPEIAAEFASHAKENGIKVLICAAGMAAHLAGVMAAHTTLPVIGIPVASEPFNGLDSLLSTVQMPPGIPVATVAINGGANAGLLAAKILATSDPELLDRLKAYSQELKEQVEAKDARLQKVGYKVY